MKNKVKYITLISTCLLLSSCCKCKCKCNPENCETNKTEIINKNLNLKPEKKSTDFKINNKKSKTILSSPPKKNEDISLESLGLI